MRRRAAVGPPPGLARGHGVHLAQQVGRERHAQWRIEAGAEDDDAPLAVRAQEWWHVTGRASDVPSPHIHDGGGHMPKGEQRSNKMSKKPKKDSSPPKQPGTSDRPMPPTTSVIPRGKIAKTK
jgi:hypothetical protein